MHGAQQQKIKKGFRATEELFKTKAGKEREEELQDVKDEKEEINTQGGE
jgi:hypothetical protein